LFAFSLLADTRPSGKLHVIFTPVDPISAPSNVHLVAIPMYIWWSCWVPPPGPECVHVASTFTYYILKQNEETVNASPHLFLTVPFRSYYRCLNRLANQSQKSLKSFSISVFLYYRIYPINNAIWYCQEHNGDYSLCYKVWY
jgi:hypothetical protein